VSAPRLLIAVELEARPRVAVQAASPADAERLRAWIRCQDDLLVLATVALLLAGGERLEEVFGPDPAATILGLVVPPGDEEEQDR
jgi:hypothetical protein